MPSPHPGHRQLPAELARLEAEYANLLTRVDAGQLPVDAAFSALEGLTATDATGATWSMSPDFGPPDTMFLRAEPGGAPTPADPATFATNAGGPVGGFDGPPFTGSFGDSAGLDGGFGGGFGSADFGGGFPTQTGGFGADTHPAADGFGGTWGGDSDLFSPPTGTTQPGPMPGGPSFAEPARVERERHIGEPASKAAAKLQHFLSGRLGALLGQRRRTLIVAVAVLVAVIALVATRGGEVGEKVPTGDTFAYQCDPLPADVPISGLAEGELTTLMGCLEAGLVGADAGPQIASVAVTTSEGGGLAFDPARTLTRAELLYTAGLLLRFHGVPAAETPVPADLSALDPDKAAYVQAAVDAGFVDPANLLLDQPATRAAAAVVFDRLLATVNAPAGAVTPAALADSGGIDPAAAASAGRIVASGIGDTAAGEPFRFNDPLTAAEWVTLAGRTFHEMQVPGSMAARLTAAQATPGGDTEFTDSPPDAVGPVADVTGSSAAGPAAPTMGAAPTPDDVAKVVAALTSGDTNLAVAVVANTGGGAVTALHVAELAGSDLTGLSVKAGPVERDGEQWVSILELTNSVTGDVVATAKVTWLQAEDRWQLDTWPEFTPAT